MAAQRNLYPEPERRQRAARDRSHLRLVERAADSPSVEAIGIPVADAALYQGLLWGVTISVLGFWLPVATALFLWLG
jgi:hypothetical protein